MDELPVPKAVDPAGGPGEPVGDALRAKKHERPTPDMMYLASRLNGEAAFSEDEGQGLKITPAALQKWIVVYGVVRTTEALRTAWGFPPLEGIANPFAYVQGILRGSA